MRYPRIYARTAEAFVGQVGLTSVDVQSSPLSGARNIVEVIFWFTHRTTGYPEKSLATNSRSLVTKMCPYYDR